MVNGSIQQAATNLVSAIERSTSKTRNGGNQRGRQMAKGMQRGASRSLPRPYPAQPAFHYMPPPQIMYVPNNGAPNGRVVNNRYTYVGRSRSQGGRSKSNNSRKANRARSNSRGGNRSKSRGNSKRRGRSASGPPRNRSNSRKRSKSGGRSKSRNGGRRNGFTAKADPIFFRNPEVTTIREAVAHLYSEHKSDAGLRRSERHHMDASGDTVAILGALSRNWRTPFTARVNIPSGSWRFVPENNNFVGIILVHATDVMGMDDPAKEERNKWKAGNDPVFAKRFENPIHRDQPSFGRVTWTDGPRKGTTEDVIDFTPEDLRGDYWYPVNFPDRHVAKTDIPPKPALRVTARGVVAANGKSGQKQQQQGRGKVSKKQLAELQQIPIDPSKRDHATISRNPSPAAPTGRITISGSSRPTTPSRS